ncbi:hypothetical protein GQ44DRAFT_699501 [Phaeosphaeriaceae sp. PMI808]|nr:hypothetical protein GQ44DRAFT_699501 [Phaeosphaeriaceae sp. PMI808]
MPSVFLSALCSTTMLTRGPAKNNCTSMSQAIWRNFEPHLFFLTVQGHRYLPTLFLGTYLYALRQNGTTFHFGSLYS